jgi:outer membrane protein assembly factor BamB
VGVLSALLLLSAVPSLVAGNWPGWRGPSGDGVVKESKVPLKWSSTENIRWKVPLPERGNSSPVVWGNRIFLTQALEAEKQRTLMCLDRETGKTLWHAKVAFEGEDVSHSTNPYCSASPITDGERVIVWYGSAGVHCYDLEGKLLWQRDLGVQKHDFGYGSSPILHEDLCILNFGPGDRSFVIAMNKETGETVWQVDVPDAEMQYQGPIYSYSTPIVIDQEGIPVLVTAYPARLVGLNPKTGEELWRCEGLDQNVGSSPVYGDGVAVIMAGFRGQSIAFTPKGKGDLTESHRLWQIRQAVLSTGVIHDGHFYALKSSGVAMCLDLQKGTVVWEERLASPEANNNSWSSMNLVGDKIYVPNQSGVTFVLKAAPKFEVLAVNRIEPELTNASLAFADGQIYLRTHTHLWCIGETDAP